jgi:probable HAF family extracellular repeat protein
VRGFDLLVILAVCLATPTAAQNYIVTDIGLGYASAINNSGQVVGTLFAFDGQHAFLWTRGIITDLGTLPGYTQADPTAINELGQVVGEISGPAGVHGFLWSDGVMIDLGDIPGYPGSLAGAINSATHVVGALDSDSGGGIRAFIWAKGVMRNLNELIPPESGWILGSAAGINDSEEIAGTGSISGRGRAFLLRNGDVIDLGTLRGATTTATAINALSQVVGSSDDGHAFLWTDGVFTDLGSDGFMSRALAINNSGQVVGYYSVGLGEGEIGLHGSLWSDGVMIDLNDAIRGSGWGLRQARGINDAGQIVGTGYGHALLLTPSNVSFR